MIAELALAASTICGTRTAVEHVPVNSYYEMTNAPPAQNQTCIKITAGKASYTVTRTDQHKAYGYPAIVSGWNWGQYTCYGHTGKCFKYPVVERADGSPRENVSGRVTGRGNLANDIWFSKTGAKPSGQDNGTEVMIWLEHPGDNMHYARYTTIEGIRFGVGQWTAHGHGTSWHYVAYVMLAQRSHVANLWLNPFFHNAIANHELAPGWYLDAIDLGNEIVSGGTGDSASLALTGVR